MISAAAYRRSRGCPRGRSGCRPTLEWPKQAPVAQWIERAPPEREVAGSNPAGRARPWPRVGAARATGIPHAPRPAGGARRVALVDDRGHRDAAQIAFFALLSFVPLSMLLVAGFGVVFDDADVRSRVVRTIFDNVPLS